MDAFRFIVKPLEYEKLNDAISKFIAEKFETQAIKIPSEDGDVVFDVEKIVCIESWGRNTIMSLLDGKTIDLKNPFRKCSKKLSANHLCAATAAF